MSLQNNRKPVHEIVAAIESLDLEQVKLKLMHPEAGEGWSREVVDALESDYKRFLTLHAKYPDTEIVPSREIDEFWHAHILDTMKYADDCERTFGYFLHHMPSVEVRSGEQTTELYKKEFGVNAATDAYCAAAKSAYCALGTKSAYCAVAAKAAYCAVAAQPAYCALSAKPSYCAVATKKSYCAVAAKKSYCAAAAPKKAYCAVAKEASYCALAVAA